MSPSPKKTAPATPANEMGGGRGGVTTDEGSWRFCSEFAVVRIMTCSQSIAHWYPDWTVIFRSATAANYGHTPSSPYLDGRAPVAAATPEQRRYRARFVEGVTVVFGKPRFQPEQPPLAASETGWCGSCQKIRSHPFVDNDLPVGDWSDTVEVTARP